MTIVIAMLSHEHAAEIMVSAVVPVVVNRCAAICDLAYLLWNIPIDEVGILGKILYLATDVPHFIDFTQNARGWMIRMPDFGFTVRSEQFETSRALVDWYRDHCANGTF